MTSIGHHDQLGTLADGSALELIRDEYVRRGFATVDILERLDPGAARRLLKDRLGAEARRAAVVPILAEPPDISSFNYSIMTGEANHTRVCRVLEFITPGDRIFEVGVSLGYITGMLLREVAISGYVGIDLTDHQIAAARQMAEIYAPPSLPVHLEVKNLYELTPEWLRVHDPDLVLLLEVLEHVPDPEKALTTLANCVRDDAAILFSVPAYGRLENVWGHISIFDSRRIRGLCEQARLVAQHVEVLQDQWVFVLATKSHAVPTRLLEVIRRSASTAPPVPPVVCEFVSVPMESIALSTKSDRGATLDRLSDDSVRVTRGASSRLGKKNAAGVQFPIVGDMRLRLELSFDTPGNIHRVRICLRGANGRPTALWIGDFNRERQVSNRTFVLRPGKKCGPFKPFGATSGHATAAEVVVEAESNRKELAFTLHRAAAACEREA